MAAIVSICVDPRLNHETIRRQVEARLARMGLPTDHVFIPNEIGGNVGDNFGGVVRLLNAQSTPIVMVAVLQHDDCAAERAGMRYKLSDCVDAIRASFEQHGMNVPILSGNIATETNVITWTDEPAPAPPSSGQPQGFRMPRMYGS